MTSHGEKTARRLVVAAAIVDDLQHPTQMLSARRSYPKELAGQWEFPGGKVDPGESPEQALHRELREELGLEVTLGHEITGPDNGAWIITDRHIMRLWFAHIASGEPQPLVEHDRIEWLSRQALFSVPWLEADVRIVEHVSSHLGEATGA